MPGFSTGEAGVCLPVNLFLCFAQDTAGVRCGLGLVLVVSGVSPVLALVFRACVGIARAVLVPALLVTALVTVNGLGDEIAERLVADSVILGIVEEASVDMWWDAIPQVGFPLTLWNFCLHRKGVEPTDERVDVTVLTGLVVVGAEGLACGRGLVRVMVCRGQRLDHLGEA